MSLFSSPSPQIVMPPTPEAPAPPPAFGMIQGQKPGRKSAQPSFLGQSAVGNAPPMSGQSGTGKTLLGT